MKDKRKKTLKNKVIYACRASVSVMLSILLLPILGLIGAMVDHANLNLSRSMVENAGELTVNAALANYDTVVKDVYGLFAMSQDYDDLSENLEEYFVNSLSAYGLIDKSNPHDSEIMNKVAEQLKEFVGNISTDDINSGVINFAYKDFAGEALTTSALSNPDVLRNQIVEFMKYRGPAEVGLDLLDSLNVFRDASEKVDVTNAKTELDEASADAADIMQQFYTAIVEFDEEVAKIQTAKNNITESVWKTIREEKADEANEKIYMYATMLDLDDQDIVYLEQKDGYYVFDKFGFKSSAISGASVYESQINDKIKEVKVYNIGREKTATEDEVEGVTQVLAGLILMLKQDKKVDKGDVSAAIMAYAYLMGITKNLTDYGLGLKEEIDAYNKKISEYQEEIDDLDEAIEKSNKKIEEYEGKIAKEEEKAKPDQDKIDDWNKKIAEQEDNIIEYSDDKAPLEIAKQNEESAKAPVSLLSTKVQTALGEVDSNACAMMEEFVKEYKKVEEGLISEVTNNLEYIYGYLHPYYAAIEALKEKETACFWPFARENFVEYLFNLGKEAVAQIDKVNTMATNLDSKANEYGKVSEPSENRRQDEYYQLMKSEAAAAKAQYNINDVQEIVDQIEAVKIYLFDSSDSVYTQLGKKLYDEKFVQKDNFKSAKEICKSARKLIKDGMTEDDSFNAYFKVMLNNKVYTKTQYLKKISQANVEVYTDSTGTKLEAETINVPKFYVYLMANYGTLENKNNEEADNLVESTKNINDQVQKETKETETLSDDLKYTVFDGLSKNETDGDDTAAKKIEKGFKIEEGSIDAILKQFRSMTNLAKGLFNTLTGGLENARDNLLVTTYLFENFSYATIESEPKQKGEEPKPTTLTNVPINKENNALYGCELEYILYGYRGQKEKKFLFWTIGEETGPSDNIKIVQGNIFSIRFLMNSLFAITDKQLNAQTLPPAMAIQAATAGFFPYKVAQIILDICLALTESMMDVDDLMEGKEVPLMKTFTTWHCSIDGMIKKVKEEVVETVALEATELISDVYDGLTDGLQELVSSGVEIAEEKLKGYKDAALGQLKSSVSAKVEEIITASSQAILNAAGETFAELFTSTSTFSTDVIEKKVTDKVMAILGESSFGTPVKEFLEGKGGNPGFIDKLIDYVLNTKVVAKDNSSAVIKKLNGKSVVSLLGDYHVTITKKDKEISVTNTMYTDLIELVQTKANEFIDSKSGELSSAIDGMIDTAGAKIEGYANDFIQTVADENKEKVMTVAQEKIDGVKNTINEELDKLFPPRGTGEVSMVKGSTGKKGVLDNSVVSTILSFTYMDYLRLFVFLGLSGDDADNIMKRTAEVMELNIRTGLKDYYKSSDAPSKHPADDFSMSRAYTYVTLNTSVGVRPLLMSKDLFRRMDKDRKIVEYWTYDYSTLGGY